MRAAASSIATRRGTSNAICKLQLPIVPGLFVELEILYDLNVLFLTFDSSLCVKCFDDDAAVSRDVAQLSIKPPLSFLHPEVTFAQNLASVINTGDGLELQVESLL